MRAGESSETIAEWILAQSPRCPPGAPRQPPPAVAGDKSVSHGRHASDASRRPAHGQFLASNYSQSRREFAADASHSKFPFNPLPSTFPPVLCTPPPSLPTLQDIPPSESLADPIPHTWTKVTVDTQFVQQLLARFFASPMSYLSLVSQRHFMQDFREGTARYCSEALVNAILGMACRASRATSQLVSRMCYGDAFVGEAKRLMSTEQDHDNLPCIQALGVLALAELAQGNEEDAGNLARESVRACIRLLLQTQQENDSPDDSFRTVRALAYCGGFSLIR